MHKHNGREKKRDKSAYNLGDIITSKDYENIKKEAGDRSS